ncbi:hypothetical protein LAZ67_17000831, partial [Cordylochernes scorpioides]
MRQEFAAWVFRRIDIDENWLSNVLWTDDAHFSLNGEFNIQNSRIWATDNPSIFTEMPLYQPRVTVLCGFTSFIIVQLLREKALSEITFMKDGGPPHISRGAKQLLKDTFCENRVISRHFIYQWPPRSPDLTPCDFCLGVSSNLNSAETTRNVISVLRYDESTYERTMHSWFAKLHSSYNILEDRTGSAGETLLTVLEGKLRGQRSRGRRRRGYTDDLKQWTGRHEEMKKMAEDRKVWTDHVSHPQYRKALKEEEIKKDKYKDAKVIFKMNINIRRGFGQLLEGFEGRDYFPS